jgi:hypothetical protein
MIFMSDNHSTTTTDLPPFPSAFTAPAQAETLTLSLYLSFSLSVTGHSFFSDSNTP